MNNTMNNTTFKLESVRQLVQQEFSNVTETEWKNCENHVIKQFENGSWKNDGLGKKVQPVIINIDDSSDMIVMRMMMMRIVTFLQMLQKHTVSAKVLIEMSLIDS